MIGQRSDCVGARDRGSRDSERQRQTRRAWPVALFAPWRPRVEAATAGIPHTALRRPCACDPASPNDWGHQLVATLLARGLQRQSWPEVHRHRSKFGRRRPKFVEVGCKLSRARPTRGRIRPNPPTEVGAKSVARLRPPSTTSAPSRPTSAANRQTSSNLDRVGATSATISARPPRSGVAFVPERQLSNATLWRRPSTRVRKNGSGLPRGGDARESVAGCGLEELGFGRQSLQPATLDMAELEFAVPSGSNQLLHPMDRVRSGPRSPHRIAPVAPFIVRIRALRPTPAKEILGRPPSDFAAALPTWLRDASRMEISWCWLSRALGPFHVPT